MSTNNQQLSLIFELVLDICRPLKYFAHGTTYTVVVYSSDLSSAEVAYSDTSVLNAPRGISQLENGNIVVACAGFEHLVEIDTNGNFVKTLGSAGLADANKVLVIPNF